MSPFSSPRKKDKKSKLYDVFKVPQLFGGSRESNLAFDAKGSQSSSITVGSSFVQSTQIYVFSTYSITGAALCRNTWARKYTLKEKKVKARPSSFPFVHHASDTCQKAQAWNIKWARPARAEGGSHYSIQPGMVFAISGYKLNFARSEFSKRSQQSGFLKIWNHLIS